MKKKSKSGLKTGAINTLFYIAVFLCTLGAFITSHAFRKNFYGTLSRLNEKSIATITFKYKTAQRRFSGRVAWDRLRQGSPLYNGDTIHTSSLSEATVTFPDGNTLVFGENTMVRIFVSKKNGLGAELTSGQIIASSPEGSSTLTLYTSSGQLELEKDSSVQTEISEDGLFTVSSIKGKSKIKGEKGRTFEIKEGESSSVQEGLLPVFSDFTLLSPVNGSKILYAEKEAPYATFRWNADKKNKEPSEKKDFRVKIELSSDRKFKNPYSKEFSSSKNFAVLPLNEGYSFYRVSCIKDGKITEEKKGRIEAVKTSSPVLKSPVQNFSYTYRKNKPSVKFSWTPSPLALMYMLTISKSSDMASPVLETLVSSTEYCAEIAEEGEYFCSVRPLFDIPGYESYGKSLSSPVRTFTVEHLSEIPSPQLLFPPQEGSIDIGKKSKRTCFSWKSPEEDCSFKLIISKNEDLSKPLIILTGKENLSYLGKEKKLLTEGKWYWAVQFFDDEGNFSSFSETRSFYALELKSEILPLEPSDSYSVGQNLVPDMTFSWKKKNMDGWECTFILSSDENFKNIITSVKQKGNSFSGLKLEKGKYWWKVLALAPDGEKIEGNKREFTVLPNLEKPLISGPKEKAFAKDGSLVSFAWNEVADADYYRLSIKREKDLLTVYEKDVKNTRVDVDVFSDSFVNGEKYRWEVRGMKDAIPGFSSRRVGIAGGDSFVLEKNVSLRILSPAEGSSIEGLGTILNPEKLKWASASPLESSFVQIFRISSGKEECILSRPDEREKEKGIKTAPKEILLSEKNGFTPGLYQIKIKIKAKDGSEAFTKNNEGFFTVKDIPYLKDIEKTESYPEKLDRTFLITPGNPKTVTLSWEKIEGASDYQVKIYPEDDESLILYKTETSSPSLTLDFVNMSEGLRKKLIRGKFKWTVLALRKFDEDGDGNAEKIIQKSLHESQGHFETEIPAVRGTTATGAVNPYGNR